MSRFSTGSECKSSALLLLSSSIRRVKGGRMAPGGEEQVTTARKVAGVLAEGPGVAPWRQKAARHGMSCRTQTRAGEDGPFCHISSVIWAQTSLNLAGRSLLPASPPGLRADQGLRGPQQGRLGSTGKAGGRRLSLMTRLPSRIPGSPGRPARCITPLAAPDCGLALDLSPPCPFHVKPRWNTAFPPQVPRTPGAGNRALLP